MPETTSNSARPRVLSGMRPTGKLHLGNYMGALANWVKLQADYACYFFIADLHALTTDYADTSQIASNTIEVALDFLSAGLDPERSTIFVQSHVKQHYELPLLLGMITPLGWLERVPSYKEMQENLSNKDLTTFGFLGYPVLMASDILLYQPQFVPVGQDQQAHVELTREIARRFNFFFRPKDQGESNVQYETYDELVAKYGADAARKISDGGKGGHFRQVDQSQSSGSGPNEILIEPQVLLTPSPKLPGTDGRKMSKSYGNTIQMTDSEQVVRQKLKTMVTDPARIRRTDKGDPDKCPVGDLHKVFSTPETLAKVYDGCRSAGIGCIECKGWAADALVQVLNPIQERRAGLTKPHVKEILRAGSERAQARAGQTMEEVHSAMQLARMD
ncbi:MAG TPA: tryptophan--tRNA ligase [Terracidiphilus sp.]|nr:tryptophan--tRNA ligase [Terracidiphilus sp.]